MKKKNEIEKRKRKRKKKKEKERKGNRKRKKETNSLQKNVEHSYAVFTGIAMIAILNKVKQWTN